MDITFLSTAQNFLAYSKIENESNKRKFIIKFFKK